MRFSDFFERDFLENNKIRIEGVKANESNKTFLVSLRAESLLDITQFKELIKGLKKLENELRKYQVNYQINYDDLQENNEKLYLEYFNVILKEIIVDYELLSLANHSVAYKDLAYTILVLDENKVPDKVIEKALGIFNKHGLKVTINKELLNKDSVIEMKQQIELEEYAEISANIEAAKEIKEKQDYIAEQKKYKKKVKANTDEACENIANIPSTQSGIDEYLNTRGGLSFTVKGEIFDIQTKKLPKSELFSISIYDGTDSISVKRFATNEGDINAFKALKIGDIIRVTGNAEYDTYSREVVLRIIKMTLVGAKEVKERKDTALVKRVELHAHTHMSALDALPSANDYIKQAVKWGHPAIAFTDHDGAYAYHDIMVSAEKNGIKPIYGVELGFVDEQRFNIAFTEEDINLKDATYVVFDIETTGFSVTYDRIIQIAARKVLNHQVIETFEEFVNPQMSIPAQITSLTSITDDTVKDAKTIEDVLPRFLQFIDGCILVAQNASFDVGHIYANMERLGYDTSKKFPVIDTMQLARNFYHEELKTFNLKSLAKFFKVQQTHHHLADDDTRVTTEIFLQMLQTLYKNNIYNYKDINASIDQSVAYKHIFPYHINLLAKNQDGYKNIFKMISDSLTVHFHNETRLLKSVLDENREGVLVGSGCVHGEIFELALNKTESQLEEAIKYYDFIEVQPPIVYACAIHKDKFNDVDYMPMVMDTIKRIIKVAKKHGKIVCATGDCHYINKEDKIYRDIYISAPQIGGGLHDLASCYETPLQHFRTTDEMLAEFSFLGVELAHEIVVDNTLKINDMIEPVVAFKTGKNALYSPDDGDFAETLNVASIKEDLVRLVYEKAYADYGNPLPLYVQARIDKELKSIIDNKFSPVYYMAYLLVSKSNSDGYVVGSRGSVGSSFVATMMKITEVNPLVPHYFCRKCHFSAFKFNDEEKAKYGLTEEQILVDEILQSVNSGYDLPRMKCPCCGEELLRDGQDIPFETFLGFAGDKVPDIDLNFSGKYQPIAHEYIRTLMGNEHAFRAGTVTTVAEKTAIGYVKGYLERKGIEKRNTEINRIAKKIEGVRRSTGQHPGGIVVVPKRKEIYDVTPIQYPSDKINEKWRTTHFDYHQFEDNLLKLDILGHDDPTTLRFIFDYVEAHPEEFSFQSPQDIPIDDPKIYQLFNQTDVIGLKNTDINSEVATFAIPEFGTRFTRQMLEDTRPKNFADLVKISGLSHGTDVWTNNCQDLVLGKTQFGKIPFESIIGCRDDIMVYLMKNGLEPIQAFEIMEYVRKGKAAKKENPPKWEKFVNTMKAKGIPEWYYWSCDRIAYMFPKAHAVAYVLMAVRIAWFKIYKPLLFYSAFFSVRIDQFEPHIMLSGVSEILKRVSEIEGMSKTTAKEDDLLTMYQVALEMLKRGYKFLPVDINKSHSTDFLMEGDSLRLPFIAIPGLGLSVAKDIVEKREEKAFTSIKDVNDRTRINKTVFEKMKQLGSFNDLKDEEDDGEVGLFGVSW